MSAIPMSLRDERWDMKTKTLTLTAIFAAAAIAMSTLENLVPINAFIPIPGLKLGIANLAILCAYYIIGRKSAFFVGILKVSAIFLTFGNVSSMFISLCGTLLAFASLFIGERLYDRMISFIGVSAISAVFHATGQIFAACILTKSSACVTILLPLGLCSIITGIFTGLLMNCIYPPLKARIKT
ncbi:MAG: Gx transporter family protein [Ruminococcaceae bacterium]|nr:Gx transporter family protein [Oscillospiraceae bacterium]